MPRWPLGPDFQLELCRQRAVLSSASRHGPLSGTRLTVGGKLRALLERPSRRQEPRPCTGWSRITCLPAARKALHLEASARGPGVAPKPACAVESRVGSAPVLLVLIALVPYILSQNHAPWLILRKIRQRMLCWFCLQNSLESWERALLEYGSFSVDFSYAHMLTDMVSFSFASASCLPPLWPGSTAFPAAEWQWASLCR